MGSENQTIFGQKGIVRHLQTRPQFNFLEWLPDLRKNKMSTHHLVQINCEFQSATRCHALKIRIIVLEAIFAAASQSLTGD